MRIAVLALAVALIACGSSSAVSTVGANTVTGTTSCAAEQRQDLTFAGYLSGHVTCSVSPAACIRATGPLLPFAGITARLSLRSGNNPVQILIIFEIDPVNVGSYQAGPVGNEVTSTPTGITVDGIGHWHTDAGGGTMSIDVLSSAGAAGKVDAKLVKGTDAFTLRGSWRCTGSPGATAPSPAG